MFFFFLVFVFVLVLSVHSVPIVEEVVAVSQFTLSFASACLCPTRWGGGL